MLSKDCLAVTIFSNLKHLQTEVKTHLMLKLVGQFAGADFYLGISKMAVNNPPAVFSKF